VSIPVKSASKNIIVLGNNCPVGLFL